MARSCPKITPMKKTPLECAGERFIWCRSSERFYDEETRQFLTTNAFNSTNVGIADYGRSGVQSAAAIFLNSDHCRKTDTATYCVGGKPIVQDGKATAVNFWRQSNFEPATEVTDGDVEPWLAHMEQIFGRRDHPAMKHVLDVLGHFTQRRGQKLNHAIVLYGATQGTGKDTCFVPLVRFLGADNIQDIQPEAISGQFNDFLCAEICFVNEMINFEKKATMNRMKPWLAAPPASITINKKFAHPFNIPNVVNWVIYTNYADAISLDDTDRRFWVCFGVQF